MQNQSNPYKTKLWLFSYNSNTFCKKELELWDHIAGFGPRGCRDTNPQLSNVIDRGKTAVKKYLRNLEYHCLIERIPGWSALENGQFVKPLRYRQIIALAWPTRSSWMAASIRHKLKRVGRKSDHYQRRSSKTTINQMRDDLLYGSPGQQVKKVAPPSASTGSSRGHIPLQPPGGSWGDSKLQELVRKGLIEKLLRVGHSREHAIRLADRKIQELLPTKKNK